MPTGQVLAFGFSLALVLAIIMNKVPPHDTLLWTPIRGDLTILAFWEKKYWQKNLNI